METKMKLHGNRKKSRSRSALTMALTLVVCSSAAFAESGEKTADEVAKELSNPAGSLASLFTSLEYTTYKGDLPDADDQDSWKLSFQPVLPFPVGDKGRRIIFRPLIGLPFNQPVFDIKKGKFDDADPNLKDITFDLVYAGTEMKDKHNG